MNFLRFSLVALTASVLSIPAAQAQPTTATTDPVGFVKLTVAAGGGGKVSTLMSVPLLDNSEIQGQPSGLITAVTSNSLSNSSGGWEQGALADPAAPFLVLLTSGQGEGRMFLISANTSTELTIAADDLVAGDLSSIGVAPGDTYKIFPCDTLSSLFGTPETTGVVGGSSARDADTILLTTPLGPKTYYYSTSRNEWLESARAVIPANNVPLRPYYGILYSRLGGTPLEFTVTGGVPTMPRAVPIANSGTTLLAQYWPATTTLSELGLQNMQGWVSGPNAKAADRVVINNASGVPATYFFNGTDWLLNARTPAISNDVVIPVGASVQVQRRNSNPGYAILEQQVPYTL